jgi:SAM-dependent methyltransferase
MEILIALFLLITVYLVWKYWALILGAGYDPTPVAIVQKMLDLAKVTDKDKVFDLGSGDGRIVCAAAEHFGARCVGIEADPVRFLISWIRVLARGLSARVKLRFGNFFRMRLNDATVVTLFLFQPTNNRLKEKFIRELKPGTRIVTYTWTFDGWEAVQTLHADMIRLYIIK